MTEIEMALERARDTKALEFGAGAMEKVPAMFSRLFPGKKVGDVKISSALANTPKHTTRGLLWKTSSPGSQLFSRYHKDAWI